ncbi:hypothetical protein [uncultured Brevibacillus sp.]|uniref:hypothetical protein n=1 Tax=uncultured Brevibacillus sp. TaxID=169970 RepID=UPI002597DB3F|nr:hypothetical protein [uncultured Brevibacillus sp.]
MPYIVLLFKSMAMLFAGMPQWIQDLNNGVFALVVNIFVMVAVSLVTKKAADAERLTQVSETIK